jgi:hypothetical protein
MPPRFQLKLLILDPWNLNIISRIICGLRLGRGVQLAVRRLESSSVSKYLLPLALQYAIIAAYQPSKDWGNKALLFIERNPKSTSSLIFRVGGSVLIERLDMSIYNVRSG